MWNRLPSPSGRRSAPRLALALALLASGLGGGCGEAEDPAAAIPPAPEPLTARPELVAALRADLAAERHPGDGGGRARLASAEPARPRAGEGARFEFVFEAGAHGIAVGGEVQLQAPPFWGWSTPQVGDREAPGFSEVRTEAAGVTLTPRTLDEQLLGIEIGGRALAAGERVHIVYGAGTRGAVVDRFAERASRFRFAVDADGDGVRAFLDDAPAVAIAPGPPERLAVFLPATARVGDVVPLRIAVLDATANAGVAFAGRIALALPDGLAGPESVALAPEQAGLARVELRVTGPGIHRLRATGPGGLAAESNPLGAVAAGDDHQPILWADLHGHSGLSDGTGTPEDFYAYARDVAGLDVVALTDHDHWGLPFLDASPEGQAEIHAATRRFHEPGRFVTLHGYEWTNWVHGHRHVLTFDDSPVLFSALDPDTDDPAELWAALRGRPALTFAHHSAGGPVATDWSFPPDPELEPVTEIVSVHGSSEAMDSPFPIYAPLPGNFVRDVLARGARLGFVGSGDGHDGHPGLTHWSATSGGLAGVLAEEPTRAAVLAALRARRVYATNGPRILLDATYAGRPMGSDGPAASGDLQIKVGATAPLDRVELIGRGGVLQVYSLAEHAPGEDLRDFAVRFPIWNPKPGDFRYVRVVQRDGGAAWSSPFFFSAP